MTITDFLLARITEDEAEARAADLTPTSWPRLGDLVAERHVDAGWHVLHWQPARVLAECEAKRRIVASHGPEQGGDVCDEWEQYPCPTIRALASVYADHADYREEWRS